MIVTLRNIGWPTIDDSDTNRKHINKNLESVGYLRTEYLDLEGISYKNYETHKPEKRQKG